MGKILVQRQVTAYETLKIVEERDEYFSLMVNDDTLASAFGRQALSMMDSYFDKYYNVRKDFLYPEMPFAEEEFEDLVKANENLFQSILDETQSIPKAIEKYNEIKNTK